MSHQALPLPSQYKEENSFDKYFIKSVSLYKRRGEKVFSLMLFESGTQDSGSTQEGPRIRNEPCLLELFTGLLCAG